MNNNEANLNNKSLTSAGNLTVKSLIIMGGALFSMHFGVASMVWPVEWGKNAGTSLPIVYMGIWITGVFLTFLAYVCLARTNNDFTGTMRKAMGNKLGNGVLFALITLNCPLYGIPMMTAATWMAIEQTTGYHPSSIIPILVYNVVFYGIAYLFILKPGKAMDRIGKALFPVLIVLVVFVIISGIVNPISDTVYEPSFSNNAFAYGLTNGYVTTEILCALLFGVVIMKGIQEKGVPANKTKNNTIKIAAVGMGILTFTHLGNMILGAHSGEELAGLEYTALYLEIVKTILGRLGAAVFVIALLFACLTTAVGLGAAGGEFYEELTDGKMKYKTGAIITMVLSCLISAMGLTSMLEVMLPILDMLYPATIIFVLHFALAKNFDTVAKQKMVKWSMVVALIFGMMDGLNSYCAMFDGIAIADAYMAFYSNLPMSADKLTWIVPSIIAYIIPFFVYRKKNGSGDRVFEHGNA